ncbi:GNAT family N-acetyltransferase [Photobacterium sp. R1]
MEVFVRVLIPADIPAYREIRLESLRLHPDCFGADYEAQRRMSQMFFERNIEVQSPQHTMLGAYDGEVLIGLCGLSDIGNQTALITQMYVQGVYQGLGVGQALIEAAKQTAAATHQARVLQLDVYPQNLAAKHSYEKAGFQVTDQTEDELIMTLVLS